MKFGELLLLAVMTLPAILPLVATMRRDGWRPRRRAASAPASATDHVAVLDRAGRILAVNDAWNTFGAANGVEDLAKIGPGANYLDVCARAARSGARGAAAAYDGIEAVCQGRQPAFELEYVSEGPEELAWFEMKVRRRRGEDGGAVVSHRNVTALKRHQIAMREREFSRLVDALPIAAKVVDASGLGRHFNPAWLRITGRTLEDELDRPWMESVHRDDRASCAGAYQTAAQSLQPATLEYRLHRHDGSELWLLDHVVPQYDDDGECTGLVSASIDITERRRDEERLRELTGQLVTVQENERRRIARELHDDVNQRIALLAIAIDQMGSASLDERTRDRMRDLSMQATEISRVVHGLSHELHSSALESLGLVPAVRTLTRELSASGLRVDLIAEDDYRDLSPDAALGVFRVIQEALSNVLKHSGATEAVVALRHSPGTLRVSVEDRGRGFNPAVSADGLGLHSMRERLTHIGGRVQVRSRPGEGTTVEASVPRAQTSVAAAPTCAT